MKLYDYEKENKINDVDYLSDVKTQIIPTCFLHP